MTAMDKINSYIPVIPDSWHKTADKQIGEWADKVYQKKEGCDESFLGNLMMPMAGMKYKKLEILKYNFRAQVSNYATVTGAAFLTSAVAGLLFGHVVTPVFILGTLAIGVRKFMDENQKFSDNNENPARVREEPAGWLKRIRAG